MSNRTTIPEDATQKISGAEAVVEMLKRHGVQIVFGVCGDTSLPFYDALARTGGDLRHVLARDERSAGYMADGYARVSGRAGVCEGPSGGGATYMLPALAEANESSVPLVCFNSDISVAARGRYTLTELDQNALMQPVTKWNAVIQRAEDIPRLFRAAFNNATSGRPGAVHIALPFDVQTGAVRRAELWTDLKMGNGSQDRLGPNHDDIASAARLLQSAQFPVFICGGGVVIAGAESALVRLAERLSAPVATSISGKGSIDEHHPLAVGVVGSNGGTPETRGILDRADLIVFAGCRTGSVTTERWRHPEPGHVRVIHVDVDPEVMGANYPLDARLVCDARLGLEALIDVVNPVSRVGAIEAVESAKKTKLEKFRALAASDERPIRPERLVAEFTRVVDSDAIVVVDAGTPCPYFSAYYDLRSTGRRFFSNRAHGALGYSLPAAIGAHRGRPNVKCVSVMGDGSFGFSCGELETAVRYSLPITFIVVSNGSYGWIKAGQRSGYRERYFGVDFSFTDHAAVAAAFGVKSWRVAAPDQLQSVLKQAIENSGPTLVDVISQPLEQAKAPVSEWIA